MWIHNMYYKTLTNIDFHQHMTLNTTRASFVRVLTKHVSSSIKDVGFHNHVCGCVFYLDILVCLKGWPLLTHTLQKQSSKSHDFGVDHVCP